MPIVDPFAPKEQAIVDPFAQQGAAQPRGIIDPFAKPEPTPEEQSVFRQVADVPLKFATGVTQGVRMITDALGASNPLSKTLRGVEGYIGELYSAQAKQDAKEIARIMKDAEDKGVADQVKAGIQAFAVAPVDTLVQTFGNAAPAIFGGLASYALRGGALAAGAVSTGTGVAMGAGTIKGSIYDAVKDALKANTRMSPEQIEQRAELAQSYGGENLDQILMGAALGTIGATTGMEPILARQMAARIAKTGAGKILEREAIEKAEREATKTMAKRGVAKQAAITAGEEMATEFPQEAQEQIAQNIAATRAGVPTPTYRGAVAAGTLGALSAVGPGGVAGGRAAAQAGRQAQFEGTEEGQMLRNLDALLAEEEKVQRVAELKQKKTPTKAERAELTALEASLAETQRPALQEEMTVPEVPPAPDLAALQAERDQLTARAEDMKRRTGFVSEFLQDDLDNVNERIQELTPKAEPTDAELAAEEARLERGAIQAEEPVTVQPPAAAPDTQQKIETDKAYLTSLEDRNALVAKEAEISKEAEKVLGDMLSSGSAEQEAPLRQKFNELTAQSDELLAQIDALDAAKPTEVIDEDAVTPAAEKPAPAGAAAPVTQALPAVEDHDAVKKQIKDSGFNSAGGDSAEYIREEWVDPKTGEFYEGYDFYAGKEEPHPQGLNRHHIYPDQLVKVNSAEDIAKAEADGLKFFIAEKPKQQTPEELQTQIRALTDQQQKLLSKNGRVPNAGTKKRAEWDSLDAQINNLKQQWADATRKPAPEQQPDLLSAETPQGWDTAETTVGPTDNFGMHPTVAEAIRNNDLNGALRALAQNSSGLTRELAARLAELKLPTTILVGQQRQVVRKVIDAQTAQQQIRFFAYINQMFPQVYDKYFQNFDRTENLERVMEGLQELSKPKYDISAVKSEFDAIVKAFADTVPNMNAPGFFSAMFDTINLNPHPQFGTANRVFLHEVVHAATEYMLKNSQGATERQQQAIIELERMFKYARERIPTKEYGFKNISEFVAEVMTNPDFQNKLKTIRYRAKPGSVFTRFVNAIKKLLGFDNLAGAAAIEINTIFSASRPTTVKPVGLVFAQSRKNKKVSIPGREGNWKTAEDVAVSIKDMISQIITRHPDSDQALKDLGPALWDASGVMARKAVLPFLQLRQLADLTASKFPQLTGAIRIIGQMVSFRGHKLREAESVLQKWAPLQSKYPAQSELMSRLMVEATIRGVEIDPDGPGYKAGNVHNVVKNAWNTLKPEFQQIYREVRDFYAKSVNDMVQVLKDRVKDLPDAERRQRLKEIDEQFGPDKLMRPYFPLRRFGEHWFQVGTGADKEFYMFESATARNVALRRRRRELQASGDESQKELANTLQAGNGISNLISQNAATTKILEDVKKIIDAASSTRTAVSTEGPATILSEFSNQELKRELNDSMNQLIYILLPQQSMRKMFINRRSIQGASTDMLRVFSQTAVHSAYQQARFKFAPAFINNIQHAQDYVRELAETGSITAEQQQVYSDYVNELEQRSKTILGVEDKSAWARTVGRLTETTFFFMLTAPATAMMNIVGMHSVTMPYIGGRYGYKEANALMLKNLGRYFKTVPTRTINPIRNGEYYNVQFPSIIEGGELSPLLKRAAQVYIDDGDFNISTANDLFDMAEQPSALYTGRANVVKRALAAIFHQSERLNREVTMLTTFELAYNKLLKEPKTEINGRVLRGTDGKPLMRTEEEAFNDAIAEAREIAGLTLGDYTRQMKGRVFTKPGVNLLLQFKQYAITTTYIILRNLYLSLGAPLSKGELDSIRKSYEADNLSPDEINQRMGEIEAHRKATYKEARRRLAGILGMAFLYGGASAMPFFSMLGGLVGMFPGDDDDEDYRDWENNFYNGTEELLANAATSLFVGKGGDPEALKNADAVGRAIGHAITRGPVGAITGASIADRTTYDFKNLWFREGRFSPDIRDSLKEDMIANMGPFVGLLFNWVDAYKLMQEGQVSRGFETALPALFAKPLTAARLGTEGATTRGGTVLGGLYEDQFSAWELALQSMGLQPEKLAMTQKTAIQAKEAETRITAKRDALLNRLWLDYRTGSATFDDSLDEVMDFAAKYPELEITPKKIRENFDARAKAAAEAESIGAKLDKKLLPRTEPMLYQR